MMIVSLRKIVAAWAFLSVFIKLVVRGEPRFFYGTTSDTDQELLSPADWGDVECNDLETCVSFAGAEEWKQCLPGRRFK